MSATPPHSPSSSTPPPHPPSPSRQNRSDFHNEPNLFDISFKSARPSSNIRNKDSRSPTSDDSNNASDHQRTPSPSSSKNSKHDTPRPVLPPIAAISSAADSSYPWPFPQTALGNSLRSGPLSPAMLAGPQPQNSESSHLPFDFRSGLTPRTGFTPRTGLTPATGLTPLVGGGNAPFPPSPNTAALIALINNSPSGAQDAGLTITPNTLNAITGSLDPVSAQHHYQSSHHNSHSQESDNAYSTTSPNPPPNGLFLLSQAHQELTKREEAQARANTNGTRAGSRYGNGTTNGTKRNTKRKSYDIASSPPPSSHSRVGKRARPAPSHARRRSMTEDIDDDVDEEEDSASLVGEDIPDNSASTGRRGNKKPETEEEKRKNFLERNRQAALKCRQRKKQWLQSLQAKVEFLTNENDRLTAALVSSREEISRLSTLVGTAGVAPGGPGSVSMTVHVGAGSKDAGATASMQGKAGVSAGNGRSGYGY